MTFVFMHALHSKLENTPESVLHHGVFYEEMVAAGRVGESPTTKTPRRRVFKARRRDIL
jgi:hypothetical protein